MHRQNNFMFYQIRFQIFFRFQRIRLEIKKLTIGI